jgi:hypothetical protein
VCSALLIEVFELAVVEIRVRLNELKSEDRRLENEVVDPSEGATLK